MKKVVLDEYIKENKAEFTRIRLRMDRGTPYSEGEGCGREGSSLKVGQGKMGKVD